MVFSHPSVLKDNPHWCYGTLPTQSAPEGTLIHRPSRSCCTLSGYSLVSLQSAFVSYLYLLLSLEFVCTRSSPQGNDTIICPSRLVVSDFSAKKTGINFRFFPSVCVASRTLLLFLHYHVSQPDGMSERLPLLVRGYYRGSRRKRS